jgi:hypothetical protein
MGRIKSISLELVSWSVGQFFHLSTSSVSWLAAWVVLGHPPTQDIGQWMVTQYVNALLRSVDLSSIRLGR